jgi:predicted NBD/HSP70 family sugar kinase
MGLVLNGELYRGSGGAAGEVGYLPLAGTDLRDPSSRRRGPLDAAGSAAGVVATARRLGMTSPLTAKKVFTEARKGDAKARRVVRTEAARIALAIAAISSVLDPELVILGGGIGGNGDLLLEPVEQELRELSPFRPRIEVSTLGEEATLHGSVSMALQAAHDHLFERGPEGGKVSA